MFRSLAQKGLQLGVGWLLPDNEVKFPEISFRSLKTTKGNPVVFWSGSSSVLV